MGQLSLEKTFLLASYFEGLAYGFFVCIFSATMYIYFSPTYNQGRKDRHTQMMIVISGVMFFISTFHLAMNCYRLLRGYVDERLSPGGPAAFIGNLRPWHHILKDTLYATQENLGSAAAIYRTWVLWSGNWKIIAFPLVLLTMNIVAGYIVCGTYTRVDPTSSVFIPALNSWIRTYYSIAVVLNVITTGLMSYRIWITHRNSANYQVGKGRLVSVIRILIESAALQLIVEVVLLALYSRDINAQYILLECVTPVVGITFNLITVRIKFQSIRDSASQGSGSHRIQTIGSLPMRRIQVNVNKQVEDDTFDSGTSTFKTPDNPLENV